jgi:hypothetical protein
MPVTDITPMTWADGSADLTDANLNAEVRDAYLLLLNPPAVGLQRTTNLTLTNITWTAVGFDTLLYDTLSTDTSPQWSSGANTKVTAQSPGWYECIGTARCTTPTAAVILTAAMRVNGSVFYFGGSQNCGSPVVTLNATVSVLIKLATSDYVEFMLWQNAGASQTITATGLTPLFSVTRRRGA